MIFKILWHGSPQFFDFSTCNITLQYKVPFSFKRVLIGYCDNFLRISAIGWFKSISTAGSNVVELQVTNARSTKKTVLSNFPFIFLSAEHETPKPMDKKGMTSANAIPRTSCVKYFPQTVSDSAFLTNELYSFFPF
jgi:hypothetical protein